ncbi:MAG: ATP-binding protein [Ardenticatenaceae bacterium]|nr:ATP-binding protein [Ardenticatenaceae bacterium]
MTTIPESPRVDDLFFGAAIDTYLANPRFLQRDWLAADVEQRLNDPGCRFLLLTAEPGAGKSAFLAQLARDHPSWPRYFIRRDQVAPLGPPGARSLLLHVGLQLATCYPQLFATDRLELTIRQRLGTLGQDASAIGVEVQRLIGSPFRRVALKIIQEVERAA